MSMNLYTSLVVIDQYHRVPKAVTTYVNYMGKEYASDDVTVLTRVDRNPYTWARETWFYIETPTGGTDYVQRIRSKVA